MNDDRETDFKPDWDKCPKLAAAFVNRPAINIYWEELRALLRDARADAVRHIEDAKYEELMKAFDRGRAAGWASK
jgi:hypothetical protein